MTTIQYEDAKEIMSLQHPKLISDAAKVLLAGLILDHENRMEDEAKIKAGGLNSAAEFRRLAYGSCPVCEMKLSDGCACQK